MKIMYLGIATWPSWEVAARKMWIWRKSLDRFGYRFFYYGVGIKQWPAYRKQKIEVPLEHLRRYGWGDCTHVLYTDCCDCLMLAPQGEIEAKYKAMGCPPMLVSASSGLANVSDPAAYPVLRARLGIYKYPHVGGYLMEIPLFLETFQMLSDRYPAYGDDCFCWFDAISEGVWQPELDTGCNIWMVNGDEHLDIIEYDYLGYRRGLYSLLDWPAEVNTNGVRRIMNRATGSFPAIWHNSGGYASHETYKDESMRPVAEKLGILAPGEQP